MGPHTPDDSYIGRIVTLEKRNHRHDPVSCDQNGDYLITKETEHFLYGVKMTGSSGELEEKRFLMTRTQAPDNYYFEAAYHRNPSTDEVDGLILALQGIENNDGEYHISTRRKAQILKETIGREVRPRVEARVQAEAEANKPCDHGFQVHGFGLAILAVPNRPYCRVAHMKIQCLKDEVTEMVRLALEPYTEEGSSPIVVLDTAAPLG